MASSPNLRSGLAATLEPATHQRSGLAATWEQPTRGRPATMATARTRALRDGNQAGSTRDKSNNASVGARLTTMTRSQREGSPATVFHDCASARVSSRDDDALFSLQPAREHSTRDMSRGSSVTPEQGLLAIGRDRHEGSTHDYFVAVRRSDANYASAVAQHATTI